VADAGAVGAGVGVGVGVTGAGVGVGVGAGVTGVVGVDVGGGAGEADVEPVPVATLAADVGVTDCERLCGAVTEPPPHAMVDAVAASRAKSLNQIFRKLPPKNRGFG
jgi:hypothetical protein